MRQKVETYIKKCLNCQQNKHVIHVKYEKIQYMKLSKWSWDEVFMNFIIKLLKSKNSTNEKAYDVILVMIDRLIKYCHIIFFKKTYNVEQLKYIVLNRLIRYQRISKGLINDKDKLFTFNYWRTLLPMLRIKLKMSTTYHSQINEQTKKTNQSLKQYLRHYVNNAQTNWVKLLFMAQLTLNAKVSNTTKTTPFFANYEKESNLFEKSRNQISTKATITRGNIIKSIQKNISKMQKSSIAYQNKKKKMAPLLKEGDKMYLFTKNLKINKRRSKKLNHVKVESFFIKVVKGRMNYELNFSNDAKIHLVFHISLLKSTHLNTSIQKTFHYQSQKNQEYEVERILQKQNQQYLIKWKGYSTSKNTWEPLKNLENCQRKLQEFRETKVAINSKRSKTLLLNRWNKSRSRRIASRRSFARDLLNVLIFSRLKIFCRTFFVLCHERNVFVSWVVAIWRKRYTIVLSQLIELLSPSFSFFQVSSMLDQSHRSSSSRRSIRIFFLCECTLRISWTKKISDTSVVARHTFDKTSWLQHPWI